MGSQAEAERQRHEAERNEAVAQVAFVVDSVATGLERLSGGDLLFRLGIAFELEYEALRADFNAATDKLQETMRAIAANTAGVQAGADDMSRAIDDLSRRTEQQAASLQETAAALDQITAENFSDLKVAWTWRSVEEELAKTHNLKTWACCVSSPRAASTTARAR